MSQSSATHSVDLQRYKISTQKSDIAGDDGFKLFIEKRDTIYNDEGHKYIAITKYTDSGDNGIEIFFTTEKQLADKSETKSEPLQQPTSNKTETVLWEKSCVPERHYLYRIMQERKAEEPVVAKLMEHVVIFDRPCLFRLSDLIKQYKTWIQNYPDYLHFKSCALGPYVDPPHPFSESYGHIDGPSCVCRLCIANRKVVEILETEGVTLDHVLDSAIDCIRNRLLNIIISQIRMSFLQKSNVYLDLSDGFEAIVPPLTILRFEKFFKELYETGMTISWEILKKLSLIVGYDINYNAAIHFITYLFESADKFVEVAERLEPMFICFDWKLIHYGLYFKVFLLHFFQEFVFQRPEIIGTWTLCYDIVRNNRQINPNRPGEMCTKDITDKYDALVVQMNVVKDLWEAKSLPFEFEEMRLPIHNVLKISSLFPPYRPLEENVKMTYTAVWNDALEQYELGPLVVSENKILDLDPILDVCLTNPKNKDEKVCIQVLCKDKPIIESTESLSENTQWGRDETLIQAVRKIFETEASGSKFSDTMATGSTSSSSHDEDCPSCFSKSEASIPRKRPVSKRKASKPETPRYAIYGRTPYQKLAAKWLQNQKKRLNLEFCKHYEKKTINDRMDYMMDKHSSSISDPKCHLSAIKHRAALQDILSFAMQMGANAVSCMENKVRHNPQNYKFYVVFHYSKCKIPEKKEPKVLVPLDQIMSLLFGTLYKHSILTEKERKSVFFQQFQGNEVNKTRDPNAKNIDWEACNANVTLSAQKLTPVPSEDKEDKEAKDSSKISDEGEEFLDLIQNALETAFEVPERKKVKKRLLEAFQPLLNFMEPKQEFSDEPKNKIFVKGFDKLRPIRVLTNLPPKKGSTPQEGTPKKNSANAAAPDLAHENMEVSWPTVNGVPKGFVEVPTEELLDDHTEEELEQLEQKHVRPNCHSFLGRGEHVPLPSELEPTLRIPKKCEIQLDKYLDNVVVTAESKRNDFDLDDGSTEDEEIDVVNCCGTPNCTRNHNAETRFEHVHGCLGGPQADPNCECYKSRSVASMLLSDDYHRCASQMSGLPVNPKYSQMRQKLLKTLSQRRDTGDDCEANGALQTQKSSAAANSKSAAKKEVVVVTKGGPQTEDVDALVSMIEGTNISSDPKKAAKRARQKEKKMKLQKEEDDRKQKLEEQQRRLEEILRQEAERVRLEEEERLAKERQESLALKKSKKKKKKGKNVTTEQPMSSEKPKCTVTIIDAMPTMPLSDKGLKNRLDKEVMNFSEAAASSINEKILANDSDKKTDKKTDMVTIRRHPTVPDTTVTISMKSNSGHEDVLYTLINGQVYESETPENGHEVNGEPKIKAKISKKKKKKGKNKDAFSCTVSCGTLNGEEAAKHNEDPELAKKGSVQCDMKHTVECERPSKPNSFLTTLSPESEIDLSKLKLPPGITITKVNQNIAPNRAFVGAVADSTKEVTITKSTVGHFGNGSPPPFYNNEVFKKPNVLVVDSQYTEPPEDFITRREGEKFKEVVSTKTKRLRNRAQRSKDGDDLDDDFCEGDGTDKYAYSSDSYYSRSPSFSSSKKPISKPKVATSSNSSTEAKPNSGSLPTSTANTGRNFVHPTRIFRNQQLGSYDNSGDSSNRSRYGNSVHSKYNVIPRYAKSRQRMTVGQESTSTSTTSPKNSAAPNSVIVEPQSHVTLGSNSSVCNQSFATGSERLPSAPSVEANIPDESSKAQKDERWTTPAVENEKFGPEVPNVFNVRWDALLKESYGSTFGPFTVQAADRKAWSPWGELSGTEASSPDLSSRPHSCELLHNDAIDNGTIGQPPIQKCASPVQPPVPIGVPPSRDSNNSINSLSQHFKRQCLVNPIARPSSRNSRPDSMLSNRSSVEDLSLGRILPPNPGSNPPPNGANIHLSGSNTPFGVRDLFSSSNRHDVFGETSFTPGFRDLGVSNSMADRHRTTSNAHLSSLKSQTGNFELHEKFLFNNENSQNNISLKNHFLPNSYSVSSSNPPMSSQWGDNHGENFSSSFAGLNSRSYNNIGLHNSSYDSKSSNSAFGQGNGEQMYGAFQNRGPEAIESLKMRWDINSYPNSPGAYCPGEKIDYSDFNSPFFMKAAHAAVGAERIGNAHFVGQPCYPASFEQP